MHAILAAVQSETFGTTCFKMDSIIRVLTLSRTSHTLGDEPNVNFVKHGKYRISTFGLSPTLDAF